MKLLSKTDVAKIKTNQRKTEIEEGAKLARKVDSLRELSSREEHNLTTFRDESVKELHSTILSKQAEVDELEKDIKVKKEIREKLMQPLQSEWDNIDKEKATLVEETKKLNQTYVGIGERERQLEKDKRALELDKRSLDKEKLYLDEQVNSAVADRREAERLLNEQKKSEAKVKALEDEVVKALTLREGEVAIREKEVKLQADNNRKVSLANETERVWLSDQRATLEKTLKRIKK